MKELPANTTSHSYYSYNRPLSFSLPITYPMSWTTWTIYASYTILPLMKPWIHPTEVNQNDLILEKYINYT